MDLRPIKNEGDYQVALERLNTIFDAPVKSKLGDEADLLSMMIDNYENEHYAIEAPDPIEAIKIRMEDQGLRQKDMIGVIGEKGKVSEVLNKKRKLSLNMIRRLTDKLQLSASLLIRDYELI
ncbi:MAG: transcriptional regulator [Flavobacteriales bacterium]|nr:transcriptional regulator [Flavobacteriales bacterium]